VFRALARPILQLQVWLLGQHVLAKLNIDFEQRSTSVDVEPRCPAGALFDIAVGTMSNIGTNS
jgi:hypothetical protein